MKKLILPLLLAATTAQASSLDRVGCRPSSGLWDRSALEKAQRAVADAQGNPDKPLVLAEALAGLAETVTNLTGDPAVGFPKVGSGVQFIQRAQEIWSRAAPDAGLAAQLQERGRQYARMGRCALAQPVLQLALDMAVKTKGEQDQQTLEAVNDLLRLSLAMDDAVSVNALAPRLAEGLDRHPNPAINLGHLYEDLGDFHYNAQDYGKAEAMTRRGLDLAKAQSGHEERRLAYKLASVYYAQLRYAEAEAMIAPFRSPAVLLSDVETARRRVRDEMAKMVRGGDLAGALELGKRTLERYQSEAERNQAALAEAQATYMSAPKSGPQLDKAAAELRKAASRANGDNLPVARMLGYVAELYHALQQLEQAERLYVLARERYAKVNNPLLLDATRATTDLAILYRMRGQPERALPLQEEALRTMVALLGSEHPDVLESQDELAFIYRALKRYNDAEPLYLQRLQRAERHGADTQELVEDLDALSEIALAKGDTVHGAGYLERTVALWEQAGPSASAQLRVALGRLAKLYRDSGQADKASLLEKRLATPPPAKKKKA